MEEEDLTVIPIAPDGDFYVQIATMTPDGEQENQDVVFLVSRKLLEEKCPALVADVKDNVKYYFLPVLHSVTWYSLEFVLNRLHGIYDGSCFRSACYEQEMCMQISCIKDMDITEVFWAARITSDLGLTLPTFSAEDVRAWYSDLMKDKGGDVQKINDWYLLGAIALYMDAKDIAETITRELQNNCVAHPDLEPEDRVWMDKNGAEIVLGEAKDWLSFDPQLEKILGAEQVKINQIRRNALVGTIDATFLRIFRQQTGIFFKSALFSQELPPPGADGEGCPNCPTIPCGEYFHGLDEVGISCSGLHELPDGELVWLPIADLVTRLRDLRKRWAEDPERKALIDTEGTGCDFLKHLIELGEKLILMDATTQDEVDALLPA